MLSKNDELYYELIKIPAFDAHTHLDTLHLSARGLHDILLYHMVVSDLYSAGCPDGSRLSEDPGEDEINRRIENALPYLQYIQNTSCFWGISIILKDLYGWEDPVTAKNWKKLHEIISTKSKDTSWPREIMKKAGTIRICTELTRRHDASADDIFQYSLEWAFFTRSQWGQYDTALLELEHAWGQDMPGAPLPVTLDTESLALSKRIHSLEDVKEAIRHYCDRIPYDHILCVASHFSTDIQYRNVTDEEMVVSLKNRANAGVCERDVYSNYILEQFLISFEKCGKDIVLQFSIGAEPLPFETGSKLKSDTIFQLAQIFDHHPNMKFQLFLGNESQNQSLCTLARELPNVSLAGYWWHNFFPSIIRKVMTERLDMVAANKQIGFFSDAYCMEWAYAKAVLIRKQLGVVLSEKVAQGQYSTNQALNIARQILYETPGSILKMKES